MEHLPLHPRQGTPSSLVMSPDIIDKRQQQQKTTRRIPVPYTYSSTAALCPFLTTKKQAKPQLKSPSISGFLSLLPMPRACRRTPAPRLPYTSRRPTAAGGRRKSDHCTPSRPCTGRAEIRKKKKKKEKKRRQYEQQNDHSSQSLSIITICTYVPYNMIHTCYKQYVYY